VSSPFATGGLVLDLAGALILALALALKAPAQRQAESAQALNFNAALDLELARQRSSAIAGALLLFMGFVFQFVASLGAHPSSPPWLSPVAASGFSLAVVGVLALVLWPWVTRRGISQRLELFEPDEWAGFIVEIPQHAREYQGVLAAYAFALGEPPRPGETPYGLATRLLGCSRWCRLIADKQLSERWHQPRY
jgi:hypothetical protein